MRYLPTHRSCRQHRRLSEVLLNLLDNAIKYNRDGGTVTVSLTAGGEQAVLKFPDNGIGIPGKIRIKFWNGFTGSIKPAAREYGGSDPVWLS